MQVNFSKVGIFFKKDIKKTFQAALNKIGLNVQCFYVNVAFVSEEAIKELNSTFRQIDKVTDVLSFPNLDIEKDDCLDIKNLKKEIDAENGLVSLGDIAICKNVAKMQAKNYGHSLKREIVFLALHGFLHLLGYDHEKEEDEKEMFALQDEILNKCGIKR